MMDSTRRLAAIDVRYPVKAMGQTIECVGAVESPQPIAVRARQVKQTLLHLLGTGRELRTTERFDGASKEERNANEIVRCRRGLAGLQTRNPACGSAQQMGAIRLAETGLAAGHQQRV